MNAIILLAAVGVFSMFLGLFRLRVLALPMIILALISSLFIFEYGWHGDFSAYLNNMVAFDHYSRSFSLVIVFTSIFLILMSRHYYSEKIEHLTDIYALIIFSVTGGILLVSFQSLVMLFLGTEILSIPLYILAASNRRSLESNEAGLKYFLTGAFFTAVLLLGITFIYGAYGSFDTSAIIQAIQTVGPSPLFVLGAVLVLCAMLFKLSAVPFHYWAPDVYQGAPTVLTAYVSTVVKIAAIGSLLKFMTFLGFYESDIWINLFLFVSILTMVYGNIVSVLQTNFKRLLAYSGIANVGFVFIAIIIINENSGAYILYNLLAYSISAILGFSIYSTVKKQTDIDTIDGLAGLITNNKFLSAGFLIALLSFAGIPPLSGFFGKYFIIAHAVFGNYVWLAVIAVIFSVIGAYNYLRIAAAIVKNNNDIPALEISMSYKIFVLISMIAIVLIGIFPDQVIGFLRF
ncbi:MAG: NADH-quinone oxidoreductase subunit N [Chitinophagales bacterium]|nr:NADH-quinone oxidoreductase subunit N [Chitinophagales bacterium]